MRAVDRIPWLFAVALVLIIGNWAIRIAVQENWHYDLFIYSRGALLALEGRSPYDLPALQQLVIEQYPADVALHRNCGFFLAPHAIWVMVPYALMPWNVAKIVWVVATLALGLVCGWQLIRLTRVVVPLRLALLMLLAFALNTISQNLLILGQTTMIMAACVIFGERAWRGGYHRLSCLLWAVAFIKPHLALALLPLAWWLDGWRRPLEILAWAAGLTLFTGLVFFGRPLFALDYLRFLEQGHSSIIFNQIVFNPQITSWNRLLYALGGPAFELGLKGTLAGYLVIIALITVRAKLAGGASRNWFFAATGAGIVVCCQVLPYEFIFLLLALPEMAERLLQPSWRSRSITIVATLILILGWTSGGPKSEYFDWVESWCHDLRILQLFYAHRAVACLALFALWLGVGPNRSSCDLSETIQYPAQESCSRLANRQAEDCTNHDDGLSETV